MKEWCEEDREVPAVLACVLIKEREGTQVCAHTQLQDRD